MTLLPLVERELRMATRRPYAYRIRMGVATAAMVIAVWGLWAWSSWIAGSFVGHSLFRTVAGIAFFGSLSAGVLLTADGISQERREGTLGLLFLTDLRPADVVFGKFAAKAVLPFYALLALVPALAVFTVVGGVTGGELWRTMLSLANTLFVSLSVALFTSMLCIEQRLAHALAFLAMAILAGSSTAMDAFAPSTSTTSFHKIIASLNLTTSFAFADEKHFQSAPSQFFGSLAGTHSIAWISLALACQMAPRAWRERRLDRKQWIWRRWRDRLKLGAPTARARAQILNANPITWLGTRDPFRAYAVWLLPLVAILVWCSLGLLTSGPAKVSRMLFCVATMHVVIRLWIALDASHTFSNSRRNGTLESLLGTPLLAREIGEGMVLALRKRFLWPGVTLATLAIAAAVHISGTGDSIAAIALLVAGITLMIDISCISWVGLWRGLATSGSTAGIVSTLARTIVLPLAWFSLLMGLFNDSSAGEFIGSYFVVALVNNLLFRASARSRLCEHFRTLALRPFGGKMPHIESKWSPINWEADLRETEQISMTRA